MNGKHRGRVRHSSRFSRSVGLGFFSSGLWLGGGSPAPPAASEVSYAGRGILLLASRSEDCWREFSWSSYTLSGGSERFVRWFGIDLFEKHYVSGLISADDLRFVPVQLQTGRAGDEPVVLNCFHREVAYFR